MFTVDDFLKEVKEANGIEKFLNQNPNYFESLYEKFTNEEILPIHYAQIINIAFYPTQNDINKTSYIFYDNIDNDLYNIFINKFILANINPTLIPIPHSNQDFNNTKNVFFKQKQFSKTITMSDKIFLYCNNIDVYQNDFKYDDFVFLKNKIGKLDHEGLVKVLFKLANYNINSIEHTKILKDELFENVNLNIKDYKGETFLFKMTNLSKDMYDVLKQKNYDFNISNKCGEQFFKRNSNLNQEIILDLKENGFNFNQRNILGMPNIYNQYFSNNGLKFFKEVVKADFSILPQQILIKKATEAYQLYKEEPIILKELINLSHINLPVPISLLSKHTKNKNITPIESIKKFVNNIAFTNGEFLNLTNNNIYITEAGLINKKNKNFELDKEILDALYKTEDKVENMLKILEVGEVNELLLDNILSKKSNFNLLVKNKDKFNENIKKVINYNQIPCLFHLTKNKSELKKMNFTDKTYRDLFNIQSFSDKDNNADNAYKAIVAFGELTPKEKDLKQNSEMIFNYFNHFQNCFEDIIDFKQLFQKFEENNKSQPYLENLNYITEDGQKRNKLLDLTADFKFNKNIFNIFEKCIYNNDLKTLKQEINKVEENNIDLNIEIVKKYCDNIEIFKAIAPKIEFKVEELCSCNKFLNKNISYVEKEYIQKQTSTSNKIPKSETEAEKKFKYRRTF